MSPSVRAAAFPLDVEKSPAGREVGEALRVAFPVRALTAGAAVRNLRGVSAVGSVTDKGTAPLLAWTLMSAQIVRRGLKLFFM